MKFGVIQCSRCRTARGIVLDSRTAQCPRCGKTMNVKKTRILSTVDSERELTSEVARLNVAISEGEEIYNQDLKAVSEPHEPDPDRGKTKDVYDEIAGCMARISGRDAKVVAAARELDRRLGEFTEAEFCDVLERSGFNNKEECENYLKKLKASNVIFEPRSGLFRCIDKGM